MSIIGRVRIKNWLRRKLSLVNIANFAEKEQTIKKGRNNPFEIGTFEQERLVRYYCINNGD